MRISDWSSDVCSSDLSYYGNKFHGRRTSNLEVYDMYAFTAAHKTLPLPSFARVTNLANGQSVVVRVNDRGPFHDGRIIDLKLGRASCRDRVCQYVSISGVDCHLKKKYKHKLKQ